LSLAQRYADPDLPLAYRGKMRYHHSVTDGSEHEQTV
jgi:hypothetical protein